MTTATLNPPVKQRMTVEEFLDFCERPENANATYELIRGQVFPVPNPALLHGIVCNSIAAELTLYARLHRKGFVATNDSGVIVERDPDSIIGPGCRLLRTLREVPGCTAEEARRVDPPCWPSRCSRPRIRSAR